VSAIKNNHSFKFGLLPCLVLALSGCWLLGDRIHESYFYTANISMKDGETCFNLKDRRKKWVAPPGILDINVFPYPGKAITPIWSYNFSKEQSSTPTSKHECIIYDKGAEEALPLQQGSAYSVSINSYKGGKHMEHTTIFRPYRASDYKIGICRLKWDNEINSYDLESCEKDEY